MVLERKDFNDISKIWELAFDTIKTKPHVCRNCEAGNARCGGAIALSNGSVDVFYYCDPSCWRSDQIKEDEARKRERKYVT